MPEVQEPVVNTETATEVSTESLNGESTIASPTETNQKVEQVLPNPELEEMRKQLNQANMRANQLENQRKEEERKRLEEANEFKTLYEQSQAELQARTAAEEEAQNLAEAKSLRKSAIEEYSNEAVKKAALAMLEKNDNLFYWNSDVSSDTDAKAQVKAQLDAIAGAFPQETVASVDAPIVDANNPFEATANATAEDLDAMKKRIGHITF